MSWLGRNLKTSTTLGLTGARVAAGAVRRVVASRSKADEHKLKEIEDVALKLYRSFGDLKGPIMKAAQMASYVDLALPAAGQEILAKLQDRAPPMSAGKIAQVMKEELGAVPEDIFDDWEPEPFAAASIGQVHRARTKDGATVAVKVQYPGIREALQNDLMNAKLVSSIVAPVFRHADSSEIAEEIRVRLTEETSYEAEAANQTEFKELYRDDPEIVIPRVFEELSSDRVLTCEYVEGTRFGDFVARSTQEEKNRAGETIARFAFGSIFRHHLFNCDPHPGNYLFLPDGRVCFLDFGCVKRFPLDVIEDWKILIRSVLERDMQTFERALIKIRIATRPAKFDFEYQFHAVSEYFYRPWLYEGPFRYTREYAEESVSVLLLDNPNQLQTNVPADFVFANRLQWGLNSILGRLEAEADWRSMLLGMLYEADEPWPEPWRTEEESRVGA